jgi:hypothetical protein
MALTGYTLARPLNCATKEHNPGQDSCPKCNQWHLRPGYCQSQDETFRETETVRETPGKPWEAAGVSKATYYRNRKGAPST